MKIFQNANFYTTVNHLRDLPETRAEVAFAGRSNAGKSSALNTLTHQTKLAFVSKTPGRTQHINFFDLKEGRFLVDLPGYGFANVPAAVQQHWAELLGQYLQTRLNLIGLVLIMDSRHPLKALDITMLDFFGQRARPIHILLSKADKLSRQEQNKTLQQVQKTLSELYPQVSVQLFSSLKKTGREETEEKVASWFRKWLAEEDQ